MNYTTQEVADIFRVKVETVREWLRTGKLTGYKVGRAYLIPQEKVNTILFRQKDEQFYQTS